MLQLLAPLASVLGLEASVIVDRVKRNGFMWAAIALFGTVAFIFVLITCTRH